MKRRTFVSSALAAGPMIGAATHDAITTERPDTLDLADRASAAINALTGALDPEYNYEVYFKIRYWLNPAIMEHDATGLMTNNPKFLESLPRMRVMTGSAQGMKEEAGLLRGFLAQIASDGLYYAPYRMNGKTRTWNGSTEDTANVYGNARAILAMFAWYEYDADKKWPERIDRMVRKLCDISISSGDYSYYPGTRVGEGFSYTSSGWKTTEEFKGDRSEIMMYHGGVVRALTRWHQVSGDRKALESAGRLVRYLRRPEMWKTEGHAATVQDSENGRFSGQFHGPTSTLWGLLQYSTAVNDPELKEFVRRGYEYARTFGIGRIGYFPESTNRDVCETCATADMVALAIKLSDAGAGDYWDDVDQYVRNTLVEHQLLRADYLFEVSRQGPHREVDSPRTTSDRVIERNIGAFVGYPRPGSPTVLGETWTMHCCTGNGSQALYYAWEGAMRHNAGLTTVNLLLNRASQWLDVDSFLPYEGKVVLKSKVMQDVALRIPGWVENNRVESTLGSERLPSQWVGRHLLFRGLRPGQTIQVRFPVPERRETYSWFDKGRSYTFDLKGNTVVDVNPRDKGIVGYPIYQREDYAKREAPMKRARRFAGTKLITW